MPQITIVIPFLGTEKELESTLVSILENRPYRCEIIVAHAGNYADPYDLGDEVKFVEFDKSKFGIAHVVSKLVDSIESDVVHLLGCGVRVRHGWTNDVLESFEDPYIGSACPVVVDENDTILCAGVENSIFYHNRFLANGQRLTNNDVDHLEPVGPSQMAGFFRRESLQEIDCLESFSDGLFGLEVSLSLESIGYECKMLGSSLVEADPDQLPQSSGAESQKAIWRYAGSMGFFQGIAVSLAAMGADLVKAPFQSQARKSLGQRFSNIVDSAAANEFREFVDQAVGPQTEGSTISISQDDLSLSGMDESSHRRAA